MQNADTCFENVYLALLANTFLYLVDQPESEWRNKLLDQIYHTTSFVTSKSKPFKLFLDQLVSAPRLALVTEHPEVQTKCEDPSKALLALFYLIKKGTVVEQAKKMEILDAIHCDIYGRLFPAEIKICSLFKLKNEAMLKAFDFSSYIT